VHCTRRAVWRTAPTLARLLDMCFLGGFPCGPNEGLPFWAAFSKVVPQTGQASPAAINDTAKKSFSKGSNGLRVSFE